MTNIPSCVLQKQATPSWPAAAITWHPCSGRKVTATEPLFRPGPTSTAAPVSSWDVLVNMVNSEFKWPRVVTCPDAAGPTSGFYLLSKSYPGYISKTSNNHEKSRFLDQRVYYSILYYDSMIFYVRIYTPGIFADLLHIPQFNPIYVFPQLFSYSHFQAGFQACMTLLRESTLGQASQSLCCFHCSCTCLTLKPINIDTHIVQRSVGGDVRLRWHAPNHEILNHWTDKLQGQFEVRLQPVPSVVYDFDWFWVSCLLSPHKPQASQSCDRVRFSFCWISIDSSCSACSLLSACTNSAWWRSSCSGTINVVWMFM